MVFPHGNCELGSIFVRSKLSMSLFHYVWSVCIYLPDLLFDRFKIVTAEIELAIV